MMSFTAALILFLIGLIGMGIAFYGDLSPTWTLISFTIGLGAWIFSLIWGYVDRAVSLARHLKKSWDIQKSYNEERKLEKKQVIQRRSSEAKAKAKSQRLKLWINTLFGMRD